MKIYAKMSAVHNYCILDLCPPETSLVKIGRRAERFSAPTKFLNVAGAYHAPDFVPTPFFENKKIWKF